MHDSPASRRAIGSGKTSIASVVEAFTAGVGNQTAILAISGSLKRSSSTMSDVLVTSLDVNEMSTGARNQPQPESPKAAVLRRFCG